MVWQRAGTVSVQNGSTTVAGTGVDFAASSRVGDSFVGPDGATYEVANVASATVISILPAYRGATVSGASYAIMPVQGYDKMLSDAFNNLNNQFGPRLAALGTTGNYDVLPIEKGGTGAATKAAARGALELTPAATARTVTSSTDTTADSLVTTGWMGLGASSIPWIANATSLSTARFFSYGTNTTQNLPPGADYGEGLALAGSNPNEMTAFFINHDSDRAFMRRKRAGTWETSAEFYHTKNTTRASDGTLKAI